MLCAVSVLAIAFATLRPGGGNATDDHFCIVCGDAGIADAILNIALFAPLGLGLALAGVPRGRAFAAMLSATIAIELSQGYLISGRDAVAGDVLANAIGGFIGHVAGTHWRLLLRPGRKAAFRLTFAWAALWLLVQAASSAALVPLPTRSPYYGQIAHDFPHLEHFEGSVTSFTVGPADVPEGRLPDGSPIARALRANQLVATTATIPHPTRRVAPIAGVMDREHRLIAMLGQRGSAMVFSVRTTAAEMRLRPPQFLLRDASSALEGASDTAYLSARWGPRSVMLEGIGARRVVRRTVPLSPELGWMLLVPFEHFVSWDAADRAASCVWVALLLVPLGYWSRRAVGDADDGAQGDPGFRARPRRDAAAIVATVAAAVVIGLVAVPLLVGVAATSLVACSAAALGLAFGAVLASR